MMPTMTPMPKRTTSTQIKIGQHKLSHLEQEQSHLHLRQEQQQRSHSKQQSSQAAAFLRVQFWQPARHSCRHWRLLLAHCSRQLAHCSRQLAHCSRQLSTEFRHSCWHWRLLLAHCSRQLAHCSRQLSTEFRHSCWRADQHWAQSCVCPRPGTSATGPRTLGNSGDCAHAST